MAVASSSSQPTAAKGSEPTRIMVALSESSLKGYPYASISSRGAFDWTLNKIIRSNTSDFKLLLIHVQNLAEDEFDETSSLAPEDFKTLKIRSEKKGLKLLDYFVKRCKELGVACEAWVEVGAPGEVICHAAARVRPDFIVVGSRGLNPFQKVFVGTVSEFCIKHADCPVIAIKRPDSLTPEDPADD